MVGPCTHHNAGKAPTNDNNTLIPTSAVSCVSISAPAQTPAPVQASTPTPAPASASGLLKRYTDKNLQRVTKLALESFIKNQKYGQL